MKILVVSDSHTKNNFKTMIDYHEPDMKFHAGDSQYFDLKDINKFDLAVKGNCDFLPLDVNQTIEVGGLKIGMTHGHYQDVKYTDDELISDFLDCDIIIYGHTHVVRMEQRGSKLLLNPGSTTLTRCKYPNSYMILNINHRDVIVEVYSVKNNKLLEKMEVLL